MPKRRASAKPWRSAISTHATGGRYRPSSPHAASIRYLMGRQSLNGRSVFYHDAWSVAGEGAGNTFGEEPGRRNRVDYVLIGGRDAHSTAQARVQSATLCFDQPIDGVRLSDHFGVLVDLDVSKDD
jgi:endonuclease/exonuclease/phosphatase family metal-dependent hydrolase